MGRGDRKTTKGKIAIRSYGNTRPHTSKDEGEARRPAVAKSVSRPAAKPAAKPAVKKAAPAKKAAAKKTV